MEELNKGYFQGTFQLRNPNKKIKEFVNRFIKDNHVYVADRKKIGNGYNIKFSSNKMLLRLGKNLKSNFKGELKTSKKLYSQDRQTGKFVWRGTVLFSHYDLKVGQKVKIRGEEYKIRRLSDKVHCVNILTGKKKYFNYKDVK